MKTLVLTKNDISTCISAVIDMLVDRYYSFTAYNVTEILRSNGLYVEHQLVREYFADSFKVGYRYKKMPVLVGDDVEAILYTTLNVGLGREDCDIPYVTSNLSNFADIPDVYACWFKNTFHFSLPKDDGSDPCSEEEVDEAPEVAIEPRRGPVQFPVRGPNGQFVKRS